MGACLLQDGKCAKNQEASQISVALLANAPQTLLAASRILARDNPDPGGEVTSRLEYRSIRNRGDNSARPENTDAGNSLEPFAVVAFTMLDKKSLVDRGLGKRRSVRQARTSWHAHSQVGAHHWYRRQRKAAP